MTTSITAAPARPPASSGGQRGYLIEIAPATLTSLLGAVPVSCAIT